MAVNREKWVDKTVNVDELKLDLQNPRLPLHVKEHNDENLIRNYLLEKESIVRIARSIANNGYHHSAISIAYKDKDGKLVVLDGNRRLAASQLLANPKLVPDAKNKREFDQLAKKLTADTLSSIHVVVAPSRKAAEKEIWDIHVTPLSKPWEVLQKLRMYRNLMETGDYDVATAAHEYGETETKFRSELAKLYFYERLSEITDEAGEEELLKSGFNKIDRLILSTNGKKLLDYEIDDKGNVIPSDKTAFETTLRQITPYITTKGVVPAQSTQKELTDIVYSKISPGQFPSTPTPTAKPSTTPKGGSAAPTVATASQAGVQRTKAQIDWVTDKDYKEYAGASRVKLLLQELKLNPPTRGQNLNMVAVSLRVAIELAIYHALSKRGSIQIMTNNRKNDIKNENAKRVADGKPLLSPLKTDWAPTLNEMLSFMIVEANGIVTDPQERRALAKIQTNKKAFVGDMDSFIHNVSYQPDEKDVRNIWESFGRPIFDIIKKL